MGTYFADPPRAGDEPRRLAVDVDNRPVVLSRLCAETDPEAPELKAAGLDAGRARSPCAASLVEIGPCEGSLWAVEGCEPHVPLAFVLSALASRKRPAPLRAVAWLAVRLGQAASERGRPHGRLSPRNVLLRPSGEPLLLGGTYARILPPLEAEAPFLSPALKGHAADAFSLAALARSLLTAEGAAPGGWDALPKAARTALERALDDANGGAGRPDDLAKALLGALDPAEGPPGPGDLASFLAELGHEPSPFPAPSSGERMIVAAAGAPGLDPLEPSLGERPTLAPDGRLLGKPSAVPTAPLPRPAQAEEPLALDEQALAHAFSPRPPPTEPSSPPATPATARSGAGRAVGLVLVVIAAVAGAAALLAPDSVWKKWARQAEGAAANVSRNLGDQKPVLRVESVPVGAEVYVGGELQGTTPLFADNDACQGTIAVEVRAPGYRSFQATVRCGEDARLSAQLERR